MKKYPFPNKKLKTNTEIKTYCEDLCRNALSWMMLDGYVWYVAMPGDDSHKVSPGAGLTIALAYPYKSFVISVQQHSIDMIKKEPLNSPFWKNFERGMFHEVIHIILWRLGELAQYRYVTPKDLDDEDEFIVDHLANVIYPMVIKQRKTK